MAVWKPATEMDTNIFGAESAGQEDAIKKADDPADDAGGGE